jgi:hypothetical protein
MVPSAFLRVFQPLGSFSQPEQARWERYIVEGGRPSPFRPRYAQTGLVGRLGLLASVDGDHADIRIEGGRYYLCPWRTRLRVLSSLVSLREMDPFEMSEAFVSEAELRRAAKELGRMRRRDPHAVPFMLQSPWHVPIRWFTLFDEEDRRLAQAGTGPALFYAATIREAVRRSERAVPALRTADLEPVADLIVELHEWLSSFDRRSILELDYGGLNRLLSWDELDDDHSARDIQEALRALSSGEFPRSAELYQSVVTRWAEVRSHEAMN